MTNAEGNPNAEKPKRSRIESRECSGVGFRLSTGDGAARSMVAMRAKRSVEAFHESQSAAGILPANQSESFGFLQRRTPRDHF
jgi:hypothetical protein